VPAARRAAGTLRNAAAGSLMSRLLLFNKPYGVLSQFTPADGHASLRDYVPVAQVYPAGRLDADSEGLLLLTDDGQLQKRIADPRHKLPKTYWVQVEGVADEAALAALRRGVDLGEFVTAACEARAIDAPATLWPRSPPIRVRRQIPTSWIELVLREGRNRQVRRMTARVGHPTLRLVRAAIGPWTLAGLEPGQWCDAQPAQADFPAPPRARRAKRPQAPRGG
jgi:23S rRNA pseudouridine2457 synthase